VLDHHGVEEIVRSRLDPTSGLLVARSAGGDGCLTLIVQANSLAHTPSRATGAQAQANVWSLPRSGRIETNGVDTFVLCLDGQFEYRDFDWVPEGQREILTLLSRLAEAYLAGKGCEGERRGFFGRRYSQLTLELDGQAYLFKGRRL
jgi:hypothetical protein